MHVLPQSHDQGPQTKMLAFAPRRWTQAPSFTPVLKEQPGKLAAMCRDGPQVSGGIGFMQWGVPRSGSTPKLTGFHLCVSKPGTYLGATRGSTSQSKPRSAGGGKNSERWVPVVTLLGLWVRDLDFGGIKDLPMETYLLRNILCH